MNMMPEIKACANCKNQFTIEPDDFAFYEKIKVPAPTCCADCCRQRRLAFRNERTLYKSKSAKDGAEIISMYSSDKPLKVYTQKDWFNDDWSATDFGRSYDFSKPFFVQLRSLIEAVPWSALINFNGVQSDYCNITTDNKNCYLVFGGDFNENCAYGNFNMHSRDSFDLYWVNKLELCYECMYSENCYKVLYSEYTRDSADSCFLYDCVGCQNCFGCVGLRNKSYHIFNKPYSKEEYNAKLNEFKMDTVVGVQAAKEKFKQFLFTKPRKYADIVKSVGSTGHNIHNTKNCKACFDVYENAEDLKDVLIAGWAAKDSRNANHFGHRAELVYESWAAFGGANRILFSGIVQGGHDVAYSYNAFNCSNVFGCVGLRNKNYCVLNKQYSKDEYLALVPRIIEHMNSMPYADKNGKEYRYGEAMPIKLSPFCYNETIAQEYYPLTKDEVLRRGYSWKEPEVREHKIDIRTNEVPESIDDVDSAILQKVIECEHKGGCNEKCAAAFRLIPQELQFYQRMKIPIPRLCSNCRHYARFRKKNPLKLWERQCMCAGRASSSQQPATGIPHGNAGSQKLGAGSYVNAAPHFHKDQPCPNTFQTSYATERPETVYCEQCYNAEVV